MSIVIWKNLSKRCEGIGARFKFIAECESCMEVDDDSISHSKDKKGHLVYEQAVSMCCMCLTIIMCYGAHRIVFAQNVINTQACYY